MLYNPRKKAIFMAFLMENKTDEQTSQRIIVDLYDKLREDLLIMLDVELTTVANMVSKKEIKSILGKING